MTFRHFWIGCTDALKDNMLSLDFDPPPWRMSWSGFALRIQGVPEARLSSVYIKEPPPYAAPERPSTDILHILLISRTHIRIFRTAEPAAEDLRSCYKDFQPRLRAELDKGSVPSFSAFPSAPFQGLFLKPLVNRPYACLKHQMANTEAGHNQHDTNLCLELLGLSGIVSFSDPFPSIGSRYFLFR